MNPISLNNLNLTITLIANMVTLFLLEELLKTKFVLATQIMIYRDIVSMSSSFFVIDSQKVGYEQVSGIPEPVDGILGMSRATTSKEYERGPLFTE